MSPLNVSITLKKNAKKSSKVLKPSNAKQNDFTLKDDYLGFNSKTQDLRKEKSAVSKS